MIEQALRFARGEVVGERVIAPPSLLYGATASAPDAATTFRRDAAVIEQALRFARGEAIGERVIAPPSLLYGAA